MQAECARGRHQHCRVFVGRVCKQCIGASGIDNTPFPQHITVLGGARQHGEIMRDEQHGRTGLIDQSDEQFENLLLGDRVERGGRLVGNDQAW